MPYAPETKLALGLDYTVGGWKPFGGELWMRFDYSYQSSVYNNVESAVGGGDEGRLPAWDFGTAQIGLSLPNQFDVSLMIENVWNEKAIYSLNDDGSDADWFGDPRFHGTRTSARPRNIGITLRKRF
jgi:outer membrane receptor protein involved in Fe transport